MRHLKSGRRLGISSSHRKSLMRNLVTALLEHGKIKTTLAKAKEIRKPLDKMIGLGKRSDLHARRQALAFVKSKKAMAKLFGEYAELYKDRNGGYSRIFRIGNRLGDNASMALIEMVTEKVEEHKKQTETTTGMSSGTLIAHSSTSLQEIKSELEEETSKPPSTQENDSVTNVDKNKNDG